MVNRKKPFMINLANRLHVHREENGAAMMFAIIVLLLCTVIAVIISMFTITSLAATQALGVQTNYNAAIQDALSDAYLGANGTNGINYLNAHAIDNPSQTSCNNANAQVGEIPASNMSIPAKWSWYSERVAGTGGQIYYNIFAYGYAANGSCTDPSARKVRLTLSPLDAISACYSVDGATCLSASGTSAGNSQTIVYRNASDAVFAYGVLGVNSVTIGSSSSAYPKIYSYDSGVTNTPNGATTDTGNSSIATNNTFKLYSDNTNLKTFIKLKNATCADQTGGDSDACEKLYVDNRQYAADISSLDSSSYLANCTSGTDWTASSGVALSNYGCYSSLTFDANVTVAAPLKIYTYGNITVKPGVQVNYGGPSSNLQIYSSSTGCSLADGSSATDITQFSALIGGSKLNCSDTTGNGQLNFYGAIAASTVSFTNPNTTIYMDEAARAITSCSAASNCRQVWNRSTFVSLN